MRMRMRLPRVVDWLARVVRLDSRGRRALEETMCDWQHERAARRPGVRRLAIDSRSAWSVFRAIVLALVPTRSAHPPPASDALGDSMWQRSPVMPALFENTARELRHAMRALLRAPGFLITSVVTLGLALGTFAGMFGVVRAVLLEPLPFPADDRLVSIAGTSPGSDLPQPFGLAAEFYVAYREQSRLLEDVAFYNAFTSSMRAGDRVERVVMSAPPGTLFSTLGARPLIGRLPTPADEDHVALLSYGLWQSWFGGDPGVIGRTFTIAYSQRTVIGVLPPEFKFPSADTRVWITTHVQPEGITPGQFGLPLVGRMVPGATREAVARELTDIASRLPARFGGTAEYARIVGRHRAVVRPFAEELLGGVARPLWVLFAAAGVVLLIAWANAANLSMVRAESRAREFAVRRAIGASRAQLVRVQMAEAFIVAALAAVLALALASLTLPMLVRAAPAGVPRIEDVHVDRWTVLFAMGVALLSAIACSVVPALRASRARFSRMREDSRGSTRTRRWSVQALVAGQTALAIVLLIASGLLVRSFWSLRQVDPGYDTKDIFTFQIAPESASLADGPSFARFDLAFMERLRALPGVERVGLVENIPLNEGTETARFRREGGSVETGQVLDYTYTAGDYFQVMGISMLEGRPFESADHLSPRGHVIVSRAAAQALWPGESAIGKRVQRAGLDTWQTVVAVVEDVKQYDFRQAPNRTVYFPLVGPKPDSWAITSPAYVLKTTRADTIAPDVKALVREIAPEAPMYRVFTMAGLAADSMQDLSFTMLTLGLASGLALLLGVIGLYGVLSYVVAQRTREIGVRVALGATAAQVRRMIVIQGARVVGLGVATGIAICTVMTKALTGLLFGVSAIDAPTFAIVAAGMMTVGAVASYVPARRASTIDPLISLRGE